MKIALRKLELTDISKGVYADLDQRETRFHGQRNEHTIPMPLGTRAITKLKIEPNFKKHAVGQLCTNRVGEGGSKR